MVYRYLKLGLYFIYFLWDFLFIEEFEIHPIHNSNEMNKLTIESNHSDEVLNKVLTAKEV